ncbi:MAG: hypothetical protein AB1567_06060 [bacterium]
MAERLLKERVKLMLQTLADMPDIMRELDSKGHDIYGNKRYKG